MSAKEMFEKLGYELVNTTNPDYEHLIMYKRKSLHWRNYFLQMVLRLGL